MHFHNILVVSLWLILFLWIVLLLLSGSLDFIIFFIFFLLFLQVRDYLMRILDVWIRFSSLVVEIGVVQTILAAHVIKIVFSVDNLLVILRCFFLLLVVSACVMVIFVVVVDVMIHHFLFFVSSSVDVITLLILPTLFFLFSITSDFFINFS